MENNNNIQLDFSPEDLDLLALAMDFLVSNSKLPPLVLNEAMDMFEYLDHVALEANEAHPSTKILEKTGNLLVVDFAAKDG